MNNSRSLSWKTEGRQFRAYTELEGGRKVWRYVASIYPSRDFTLRDFVPSDSEDQIREEVESDFPRQELDMIKEAADRHFLTHGIQYYVAARAAARAGLGSVCGNLYHHAIEMCLKARLSRNVQSSLEELKSFGHNLRKTWRAFKDEFPSVALTEFDPTIVTLNKFEKLRYPDEARLKQGAQLIVQWRPSTEPTGDVSAKAPPRYVLIVSEIDRLLATIFRVSSRNPVFFTCGLNSTAREIVAYENAQKNQLLGAE